MSWERRNREVKDNTLRGSLEGVESVFSCCDFVAGKGLVV